MLMMVHHSDMTLLKIKRVYGNIENPILPKIKACIVRGYSPTDFRNIERVESKEACDYYA